MTESKEKKIYKANILRNKEAAQGIFYLEIAAEREIKANPGQFISIYCSGLTLRRPFSIFSNNNGTIGILFKKRGLGTEYLKSLKAGDEVDIIGPLGNGFKILNKKSLLIAAGIGIAPISFLKSQLDLAKIENITCAGFLSKNEIPDSIKLDEICTDDGSSGKQGSILNYLELFIEEYKPQIIYACGPEVVLKAVSEAGIKFGIETQIAMENVMACGIGVCRGCVIKIKKNDKAVNAAICKDGPVFYGSEVLWQ